jgi:hypothetical protein
MAFVALFPVNLLLIMMTGGQVCVDPAVKIWFGYTSSD